MKTYVGCSFVLTRGKNKGRLCGKVVDNGSIFCKLHQKKDENRNEVEDMYKKMEKKILKLETSVDNKVIMFRHLNNLRTVEVGSAEYYKNNLFLEWCFNIPWGTYSNPEINIECSQQIIRDYFDRIKRELDDNIYGLDHVKNEVINFVAKRITNPMAERNNLGLIGPPGVAKTTFAKILSNILNTSIKIIPLGGVKDSSYFTGHGYVYVESSPGHIVQSIVDCKCMNPILLFDEVDKVSGSNLGSDIHAFLINLIDPSLNFKFTDHYFQRITFDLSRVMYIFTMNDVSKVNKILLDRLNLVYIQEPSTEEKKEILTRHCLPQIKENIGIKCNVELTDKAIDVLFTKMASLNSPYIDSLDYLSIRSLTRALEKILLEVNKRRLLDENKQNDIILDETNLSDIYDVIKYQIEPAKMLDAMSHMYT
jgi:ATP-dependent Lon protease